MFQEKRKTLLSMLLQVNRLMQTNHLQLQSTFSYQWLTRDVENSNKMPDIPPVDILLTASKSTNKRRGVTSLVTRRVPKFD